MAGSADLVLLGNIELTHEELNHLAKLTAMELQKPEPAVYGSLSVAVFLAWMGIFHYQDNYWTHVYKALGLPQGQVKWQRILGEAFLQTIEKYQLPKFEGKSRYITPILAHSCVPNSYLDSYFRDVVLALYKERERAGLVVKRAEVEHVVANWRRDYLTYQELQGRLAELESQEKSLVIALEVWKHKDRLKQLKNLKAEIKESTDLTALLAVPEGWLEQAEAERDNLQQKYDAFLSWLKQANKISKTKKAKQSELDELNIKIMVASEQVLEHWDHRLTALVLNLSVNDINEINELAQDYFDASRVFAGFWGRLLRLVLRRRYRRVLECRGLLQEKLNAFPIRSDIMENPWPLLPKSLLKLQRLLRYRRDIESLLENLYEEEQKIVAVTHGIKAVSKQDPSCWRERLSNLNKKIAEYKMNLVSLGKGKLEDGLKELAEQKNIHREIEALETEISSRNEVDSLLDHLSSLDKYPDEKAIRGNLIEIRKQKKDCLEKLKVSKNPLYSLNESTRTFIFHGGDLAEKFVFHSLLLMQKLDKGDEEIDGIRLPSRIVRAMEEWWYQQGKSMLAAPKESGDWSRKPDGMMLFRPIIRLGVVERVIKVELPQQSVKTATKTVFVIQGETGTEEKLDVPVKKTEDGYFRTEPVAVNLKQPEPSYSFEFRCGELCRTWRVNGLGDDNFCLLFTSQGELVESGQLPEHDAYLVIPSGSSIKPAMAEKERETLIGDWSDYEYCYLDLDEVDVVVVEREANVAVFKRQVQLKPRLLGGDEVANVKVGDGPVYRRELPRLVFSVTIPDELRLYGVRLDYPGGARYLPVEELGMAISTDNVVYVPLGDLAADVYGLCKVSLTYRQNVVWTETCAVVPDLKLNFDRDLYRPQKGTGETGQLELSSRHPFILTVQPPAMLAESSAFAAVIKFDTRQNQLRVELRYLVPQEQNFKLEVCVDIPAIRWRKNETDAWKAEVEEIWHEDLGEIQVRMPPSVFGPVKLALDHDRQVICRNIKEGIVVFNLRQFSDTLRDGNLGVQTLMIVLEDSSIPPFPLVQVRIWWEAADIYVEQKRADGRRTVVLNWKDLGRATNRVVRLWPLGMPGVDMIERAVPDGVSRVEIVEPEARLPAGRYRVQFTIDDPWVESQIELPGPKSENCVDVIIGNKEEIVEDVLENGLVIVAFKYEGKSIPVEREYWIQDITIRPEFEGEERFQGTVYTLDQEGAPVFLDCNPVSFYLDFEDFNGLPFLVDRDKDGATYCKKCRVLFWEIAHKECGREVILPEFIHVKVRRSKDGPGPVKGD